MCYWYRECSIQVYHVLSLKTGGGSKKNQGQVKPKMKFSLKGKCHFYALGELELRKVQEQPASVLIELVLGIDLVISICF